MELAAWAEETARTHLAGTLPRRWAHSQGVAARARTLAPILGDDADLLEAAAFLHDIGYAPHLARSGFHPLDGARFLRDAEPAPAAFRAAGGWSVLKVAAWRPVRAAPDRYRG